MPDNAEHSTAAAQTGSLSDAAVQEICKSFGLAESAIHEVSLYETVAAMAYDDPGAARGYLFEQEGEPAFPLLRAMLMSSLDLRIGARVAAHAYNPSAPDAPGGELDRAREAAFRRDPGRFLVGAVPCIAKAPPGFWFVVVGTQLTLCTYAARAYCTSDLRDLEYQLAELKLEHGLLVGEPDTELSLEGLLYPGVGFVGVDLSIAGRRA